MSNQQTTLFPMSEKKKRTVEEFVQDLEYLTHEIQDLYCLDEIPWCIGYSGGKDSTAILQLVWNAIALLPPEKRTKTIYVITTDTLVENPLVSAWMRKSLQRIKEAAENQKMPFEPHLLHPEISATYWMGVIGKGYPVPRPWFRWCTNRLKIEPNHRFIRDIIRTCGETILVLGIRKAESVGRANRMKKHEEKRLRDRLSPNGHLPNSLIYSPIEDWQTDEVWLYLMQWENPWKHSNKDLFAMYRSTTEENECPLVVDTSTPSCGSSRFGCWVCTLVERDKSLNAMIQNDEDKEWLQPLLDMREKLDLGMGQDKSKRDFRRIYGKVELFSRQVDGEESIQPIYGPYLKEWRETLLRELLLAQKKMRENAPPELGEITLITEEELSEIRRLWLEEKHEFDDSLPRIYQEVTGEEFKDPRLGSERKLLGNDEWELLTEITEDAMHLELMARLLDTERQFYGKYRRHGIYDQLEKCFESSSRSEEEAIKNAQEKWELKKAVTAGDADTIKQLTWSTLKFGQKLGDL
jgi:DNA sulfur modification protein DndC